MDFFFRLDGFMGNTIYYGKPMYRKASYTTDFSHSERAIQSKPLMAF